MPYSEKISLGQLDRLPHVWFRFFEMDARRTCLTL